MSGNLENNYAPSSERGGDWRDSAACLNNDPELFFPAGNTSPDREQAEKAKAVCASCLSQIACLSYALETGQTDGIWGGTTNDERQAILRRARRALRARRVGRSSIQRS